MSKSIEDIVLDNKIYFHLLIDEDDETIVMSFLDADEFGALFASIQDREMGTEEVLAELEAQGNFVFTYESINHFD